MSQAGGGVSDRQAIMQRHERLPTFVLEWTFEMSALFLFAVLAGPMVQEWLIANGLPLRASLLWIPVMVLSLHYGLLSGLIASAVAFVIYTMQFGSAIGVGETIDAFALRLGLEPLLWTIVAAFLGGMRAMAEERRLNLGRQLAEERQTVAVMSERYSRLRDRVEFLERSLTVGRDPHLRHTIRKADALADMSAAECRDSLYEIFTSAANGAALTLFIFSDRARVKLVRPATAGKDHNDIPPAAVFPAPDALGRTILEVHVERIDPDHFTQTDQVYFFELCERIGAILDKRGTQDLFRLAIASQTA